MITYVIIAIGALWGISIFIGIREEDKDIKQMLESASKATEDKQLPPFIQKAIATKKAK